MAARLGSRYKDKTLDRFLASAKAALAGKEAQTMLRPGICDSYRIGVLKTDGAAVVEGRASGNRPNARPSCSLLDVLSALKYGDSFCKRGTSAPGF